MLYSANTFLPESQWDSHEPSGKFLLNNRINIEYFNRSSLKASLEETMEKELLSFTPRKKQNCCICSYLHLHDYVFSSKRTIFIV